MLVFPKSQIGYAFLMTFNASFFFKSHDFMIAIISNECDISFT